MKLRALILGVGLISSNLALADQVQFCLELVGNRLSDPSAVHSAKCEVIQETTIYRNYVKCWFNGATKPKGFIGRASEISTNGGNLHYIFKYSLTNGETVLNELGSFLLSNLSNIGVSDLTMSNVGQQWFTLTLYSSGISIGNGILYMPLENGSDIFELVVQNSYLGKCALGDQ